MLEKNFVAYSPRIQKWNGLLFYVVPKRQLAGSKPLELWSGLEVQWHLYRCSNLNTISSSSNNKAIVEVVAVETTAVVEVSNVINAIIETVAVLAPVIRASTTVTTWGGTRLKEAIKTLKSFHLDLLVLCVCASPTTTRQQTLVVVT